MASSSDDDDCGSNVLGTRVVSLSSLLPLSFRLVQQQQSFRILRSMSSDAPAKRYKLTAERPLTFVTGNPNKLREVQQIIGSEVPLQSKSIDRMSFGYICRQLDVDLDLDLINVESTLRSA